MKQRSDIDRTLEIWMSDGPNAISDRMVDVIAARIGVQRQRRAWPFPGRTNVNTQIKLIAALAAALVVAVVGYNLLPGIAGPGTPSTTATASVQPTAAPPAGPTSAPSAGASWPTWYPAEAVRDANGAGILSAGSQATRVFRPAFTYTAADGWVNAYDEPNYYTLFPDSPANAARFASSDELANQIFMGVQPSPWFTCDAAENNSGATAAAMVAAMTADEVLATSGLVDVAIGGLTGKQFDVRRSPDWTGTCPGDSELPPDVDPEDERTRAILLDLPSGGVLAIFMYSSSSPEHDAFVAEAMPIVESFEFGLGQ
jgi:hypothetical protein